MKNRFQNLQRNKNVKVLCQYFLKRNFEISQDIGILKSSELDDELERYLNLNPTKDSPLDWWKQNKTLYPTIAKYS